MLVELKCLPAINVSVINKNSVVSTVTGVMSLNAVITKILNEYVLSKTETFAGYQIEFFSEQIYH